MKNSSANTINIKVTKLLLKGYLTGVSLGIILCVYFVNLQNKHWGKGNGLCTNHVRLNCVDTKDQLCITFIIIRFLNSILYSMAALAEQLYIQCLRKWGRNCRIGRAVSSLYKYHFLFRKSHSMYFLIFKMIV